jgi:hypothetical protein
VVDTTRPLLALASWIQSRVRGWPDLEWGRGLDLEWGWGSDPGLDPWFSSRESDPEWGLGSDPELGLGSDLACGLELDLEWGLELVRQ